MGNEPEQASLLETVSTAQLIEELLRRGGVSEELDLALTQLRDGLESEAQSQSIETGNDVDQIVVQIQARDVYGKLPEGTKVGGAILVKGGFGSKAGGFHTHGPDNLLADTKFPPLAKLESVMTNIYYKRSDDNFSGLTQTNFVAIMPSPKGWAEDSLVVTIHFFQDWKAPDSRGATTPAAVAVLLPKAEAENLVGLITITPDLLEDFYQKAFPGLDSEPDWVSGMRRMKAGGFYLFDEAAIEKIPADLDALNRTVTPELLRSMTKYRYSRPFGIGEPRT